MNFLYYIFPRRNAPIDSSLKPAKDSEERGSIIKIIIFLFTWIACIIAINIPREQKTEVFIQNQRSPVTIFASCDFSYVDEELTEKMRIQAALKEPLIYKIDPQISESMMDKIQKMIAESQGKTDKHTQERSRQLESDINQKSSLEKLKNIDTKSLWLSEEKVSTFLKEVSSCIENGIVNQAEKETRKGEKVRIMDDKQRLRIRVMNIEELPTPLEAAEEVASKISMHYAPENRRSIRNNVAILLASIFTGNLVYDEHETAKRKNAAREQTKPITIEIKKGDVILEKDQLIDGSALNKYHAYVQEKERIFGLRKIWRQIIISSFLSGIIILISAIYMYHIHQEIVKSNKRIGILATVSIANIFINAGVIKFFDSLSPVMNLPPDILPSILPLAITSVILSVLIGLRVGLYAGLFVAIITAIQMDNSFSVILNGLIISLISGFAVRYSKNYKDFFLRSVLSISLSMPLIDFLRLLYEGKKIELIFSAIIAGFSSGIFIAAISIGLLFFIETIFKVHSNMSLLTLCDYNHPLLKNLQIEAPGTYHHSLIVSTLAEQAAREIGANPIAARVAGLFHDIGKLAKPEYFTENNLDGINKHTDLNPRISSIVILNHVKEGIELAKKYKLPEIVKEVIEQHHGTDTIAFFYKKALEQQNPKLSPTYEADYKYQGPLPKSKECVIVALADVSEAASRSLEKPSPHKIDSLISEIFRKKIRDHQLDDADITLRELSTIRKSFVKTISTMMHGRISYPKDETEDDELDLFNRQNKKNPKQDSDKSD